MRIKSFIWSCCLVLIGAFLVPNSSFAYHSRNYDSDMCALCHPGGPGGGNFPDCIQCHNVTAPPYSAEAAPEKWTHSSAVIGSNTYGTWERECVDCHNPHINNGITKNGGVSDPSYKLVEFTGNHTGTVNGETTMSISDLVVNDPAWADPATWSEKTSAERGLVLLDVIGGKTFWYKVVSATSTSITFINTATYFPMPPWDKDQPMSLVYGQFIQDEVNGTSVKFGGPTTMAYDESGTGLDPTPNGICQVCHTQTTHWRSDGSFSNHFSGWHCTVCHPHEEGFKANPPPLCPCD